MIIAVVVNLTKPQAKELANEVSAYLASRNVTVVYPENMPEKVDFIISLGGDGSILSLMHAYPHLDAPILGINFGSLGFLADVTPANLIQSLEALLSGNYIVEERLMLEGKGFLAVNEVVVHRSPNYNLVDLGLTVNGRYFNTFSADGVIVATPSGSTAYSLSAGGPIVSPELSAVVITPICPHAISNRPIVLQLPDSIEIQYLSNYAPVEVAFDGISRFTLAPHERFTIRQAKRSFRLVSVPGFDYFATLRTKLNWTGSLRN